MPEEPWMEVCNTVQESVTKTITKKKKCNKAKWLSEEALQIAEKKKRSKKQRRKGKIYPSRCAGEGNGTSTLAWKITWTEEPGGLQSMELRRVGYDWATSLWLFTFMHWRRKWQATPVFFLENPRDGGAWWAAIYGIAWSRTRLKRLSSSSSSSEGAVIPSIYYVSL